MVKQDFLDELMQAKSSHVKWHAYAQALAMGVESGAEKLPSLYTDCVFGKWYYGSGNILNFSSTFVEIEPLHIKLHKIYMEIYQKYIEPAKGGMFVSAKKSEARKNKELSLKVNQLKDVSNLLISKITDLYDQLSKMDDDELIRKIEK